MNKPLCPFVRFVPSCEKKFCASKRQPPIFLPFCSCHSKPLKHSLATKYYEPGTANYELWTPFVPLCAFVSSWRKLFAPAKASALFLPFSSCQKKPIKLFLATKYYEPGTANYKLWTMNSLRAFSCLSCLSAQKSFLPFYFCQNEKTKTFFSNEIAWTKLRTMNYELPLCLFVPFVSLCAKTFA